MDYETLFIVMVSVFLIQAAALGLTWRQNPEEIGIRDWSLAAAAISMGSLASVIGMKMDGDIYGPNILQTSSFLRAFGAALGMTGWYFVWLGVRHFFNKSAFPYHYAIYFLTLFTLLAVIHPASVTSSDWRIFWVSLTTSLFAAMTMYEFMQRKPLQNTVLLLVVAVLLFTCITWFLRLLAHSGVLADKPFYNALSLYDAIIAGVTFTVSMILLTNERINQKLRLQATHDPLTGAMNRRAFIEACVPYLSSLRRGTDKLAVVVLDIDYFKRINDRYGHAIGDQVLQEFVQIAHKTLRENDLFARYGGEEFVILLHNTTPTKAEQVLQRLSETYATKTIHAGDELISITFSAGVCCATGPVQVDLETMLESADRAMYQAKEAGRNQIKFCQDNISEGELELTEGIVEGNP